MTALPTIHLNGSGADNLQLEYHVVRGVMAPRVIYQADGWTITQDPIFSRNPNLVRFYRSNGQRKLLDRIAEWDPHSLSWPPRRWVPKPPQVPQWLFDKVVAYMSFEVQ
jgi:hypothetical protein